MTRDIVRLLQSFNEDQSKFIKEILNKEVDDIVIEAKFLINESYELSKIDDETASILFHDMIHRMNRLNEVVTRIIKEGELRC